MRRLAQTVFVLGAGIVFIMSIAGCEEQNLSDTKKSRLIAAENMELKKQLELSDKELDNCLQEKKAIEEKAQKDLEELATISLQDFEENINLKEENKDLKAKVDELQKENETLKGEIN